jgi:hypothetical protein
MEEEFNDLKLLENTFGDQFKIQLDIYDQFVLEKVRLVILEKPYLFKSKRSMYGLIKNITDGIQSLSTTR